MKRRSLLDDLIQLPWWFSVILAGIAYASLRFWLPTIELDSTALQGIARGLSAFSTIIAILFLFIAALSAFHSWRKGSLLNRQTGIKSLQDLSWKEFEFLVSEAYRLQGYSVTDNFGFGSDGGVDLVLVRNSEKYLVQCKNWKTSKVGVKPVRELYGIVVAEGATGGILVCSGYFTTEATQFAEGKPLELVPGYALARLIQGIQKPARVQSKPVNPPCPRCGSEMVLRTAKKGDNAGSQFWGCSTFPKCRGSIGLK